jgi:hypothetical protein
MLRAFRGFLLLFEANAKTASYDVRFISLFTVIESFDAIQYEPFIAQSVRAGLLKNWGSIPDGGIISSPQRPDRFWNPPSLLSNRYRGSLARGRKLTTHLYLVPKLCMRGVIPPLAHTSS